MDGMTRDRLIDELRAEGKTIEDPKIISRHFGSRYEAVAWMFSNEGSRRTLTPAQRALALLRNKEEIERLKTEAQARKGKKLGENAPRGRVNDSIAVAAHVSDWTVKQIRKVSEGRVERQMSLCMFP